MSKNQARVNWFEIPVDNLDKAQAFYEKVLDVKLTPQEMGPLKMAWFPMGELDANGATGTLIKAKGYVPSAQGSMVYFSVMDIEEVLNRVPTAGGQVLSDKRGIGEYGFIGSFQDCEGNRVGLHSNS